MNVLPIVCMNEELVKECACVCVCVCVRVCVSDYAESSVSQCGAIQAVNKRFNLI